MLLTEAQIAAWIGAYLWPLTRIAAVLSVAPVFSARSLPRRVRAALALGLTLTVVPLLPPAPALAPLSPLGLLVTVQQFLVGLTMGFVLRLVLAALETAGQVVATQMGLGFASLADPQHGAQMPLLGHFYNLTGVLIFLALDGHLVLVHLLVESFHTLPVGPVGLGPADLWAVANWASHVFAGAVLVGLPAIASLLVVNVAFGVMTRAAPQLNIFAVGFPITLVLGLLIVLYTLPALLPQLQRLLDLGFATLGRVLAPEAG